MNTLKALLLSMVVMLISSVASAKEAVYTFNVSSGLVAITPARPTLAAPSKQKLTGSFSMGVDGSKVRFFNTDLSTQVDNNTFNLSKLIGVYDNGAVDAAPDKKSFDKGYHGLFDGEKLNLKGSVDNRPFDGSLIEYNFIAYLTPADRITYNHGYFKLRADYRKCVSPQCGGVFVRQVNEDLTLCPDSTYKTECYVATIDWRALGNPPPPINKNNLLVYGWITPKQYTGFGNLGIFTAYSVYEAAVDTPSTAPFVGVRNNKIVCITTPCFSANQYSLNNSAILAVSNINLTPVRVDDGILDRARAILASNKMLLAQGNNRKEMGRAGWGLAFDAQQLYFPVLKCGLGYQSELGQCETPEGCVTPQIEQHIYGGAAFSDPITGSIKSSVSIQCVDSCDAPGVLQNPGLCNVYAP